MLRKIKAFLKKLWKLNYCNKCGFTEEEVVDVNKRSDHPIFRCKKCIITNY